MDSLIVDGCSILWNTTNKFGYYLAGAISWFKTAAGHIAAYVHVLLQITFN